LGKRNRNLSSDDATEALDHERSSPVTNTRLRRSASIALQNEDGDLEETIIVTALETIPFCCHEDLLTMTRLQRLAVAEALNVKLPAALRIDIKPSSTDSFIRNAIELIVGIKRTVPGAPKAMKLGLSSVADPDKSVSPPTSPLATKTQPRDFFQASPRLAVLKEEDEDTGMVVDERPGKKRKVSAQADISVRKRRVSAQATAPIRRAKSSRATPTAPALKTVLNRTISQRIPTSHISPPRSSRVLRSHSQKLPAEMKNMEIDTTFITMQRPRYRFRPKPAGGMVNTPTPPKHLFRDEPFSAQRDRGKGSPEWTNHEAFGTSNSTDEGASPIATSARSSISHATSHGNIVWAKRDVGAAKGSNVDEDEDADMIIGLHGMTMATSGSNMDVNC
jgi:hypothetical protein